MSLGGRFGPSVKFRYSHYDGAIIPGLKACLTADSTPRTLVIQTQAIRERRSSYLEQSKITRAACVVQSY